MHTTVQLLKWLRSRGQIERDFKIVGANYNKVEVKFLCSKLELEYLLVYDWASKKLSSAPCMRNR